MTQKIRATIHEKNKYSTFKLPVTKGEIYSFTCDGDQRWKDWFISSSPAGFLNPLASFAGLRVKDAKCFCLCGCYNDQDYQAFEIGTGKVVTMKQSGFISFFANDAGKYYGNNSGSVDIEIEKLQSASDLSDLVQETQLENEL